MKKKLSRIAAVNQQFLTRIKPEWNAWGLDKHPNTASYFGRDDYGGYRYDFADLRDPSQIKLAAMAMIGPRINLWITGYKGGKLESDEADLYILSGHMKDIFQLTRSWSFWHPFRKIRLDFDQKKNESVEDAAARLIDDVVKELPRLKQYLYG
jgi:hypothetical protein